MTKLMYNGEEIDFDDEIENGEMELDTMDGFSVVDDLNNTLELKLPVNLNDTLEMKKINLEDTMNFSLDGNEDE